MKKNHLFGMFAMAAFAFASCSQDEVVTQSPEVNKAIEFGTYVGRDAQSRGSVITQGGSTADGNGTITTDALAEKGFGVFAYYTDESSYVSGDDVATDVTETGSPCNFMYNQGVTGVATTLNGVTTYSTTDWSYSPVKYWPNDPGDKLTFFAYAPHDDADNSANASEYDNISFNAQTNMKGDPIITFSVNSEVQHQQELLISKTKNIDKVKNTSQNGVTVTDKVNFQFAHALARIGFTVKAITDEVSATDKKLDENTIIVLKKVMLAKDAGSENDVPSEGIFFESGTLNLNQQEVNMAEGTSYNPVEWENTEGNQMFTLGKDHFETQTAQVGTSLKDFQQAFNLGITQGFVINGGANGNSTSANKLNNDESYVMIIPQDLSTSVNYFHVYVEYDVITVDGNLNNDLTQYDGLKSKVTNHISTKVEGLNFVAGKAYTLNLQLGMTSVKVTADVDTWVNVDGTNVDLPQNTPTPTPPAQEGVVES